MCCVTDGGIGTKAVRVVRIMDGGKVAKACETIPVANSSSSSTTFDKLEGGDNITGQGIVRLLPLPPADDPSKPGALVVARDVGKRENNRYHS